MSFKLVQLIILRVGIALIALGHLACDQASQSQVSQGSTSFLEPDISLSEASNDNILAGISNNGDNTEKWELQNTTSNISNESATIGQNFDVKINAHYALGDQQRIILANDQFVWSVSGDEIIKEIAKGKFLAIGIGAVKITASWEKHDVSYEYDVQVVDSGIVSVALSQQKGTLKLDDVIGPISIRGFYPDGTSTNITNSSTLIPNNSDDHFIVSKSSNDEFFIKAVKSGAGSLKLAYEDHLEKFDIQVTGPDFLKFIELVEVPGGVVVGTDSNLDLQALYSDNTTRNISDRVSWEVSPNWAAKVEYNVDTQKMLLKPLVSGLVTLRASYEGKFLEQEVFIDTGAPVESLEINTSIILPLGAELSLPLIGKTSLGLVNITYRSSWVSVPEGQSFFTFDYDRDTNSRILKPIAIGSSTLQVSYPGHEPIEIQVQVTEAAVESIHVFPKNTNLVHPLEITCGVDEAQYLVRATLTNGQQIQINDEDVQWSASNSKLEEKDGEKGTLIAIAEGNETIEATYLDPITSIEHKANAEVEVLAPHRVGIQIQADVNSLEMGKDFDFSVFKTFTCGDPVPVTNTANFYVWEVVQGLNQPNIVSFNNNQRGVLSTSGSLASTSLVEVKLTSNAPGELEYTASSNVNVLPETLASFEFDYGATVEFTFGKSYQMSVIDSFQPHLRGELTNGIEVDHAYITQNHIIKYEVISEQDPILVDDLGVVFGNEIASGLLSVEIENVSKEHTSITVTAPCPKDSFGNCIGRLYDQKHWWFLGNVGESCQQVCDQIVDDIGVAVVDTKGTYGVGHLDSIGGTQCLATMDFISGKTPLTEAGGLDFTGSSGWGVGCGLFPSSGSTYRISSPNTNASDSLPAFRRLCSCKGI